MNADCCDSAILSHSAHWGFYSWPEIAKAIGIDLAPDKSHITHCMLLSGRRYRHTHQHPGVLSVKAQGYQMSNNICLMKYQPAFTLFLSLILSVFFLRTRSFSFSLFQSVSLILSLHLPYLYHPFCHHQSDIHFSLCLLLGEMKLSHGAVMTPADIILLSLSVLSGPPHPILLSASPLSGCLDLYLGMPSIHFYPILICERCCGVAERGP